MPLRYLASARKELGEGKPHHGTTVPGLLQILRELRSHFIQRRDMLVLELDRHRHQSVFVLAVAVLMMAVAAVIVMCVLLIHIHILYLGTMISNDTDAFAGSAIHSYLSNLH